MSPRDGFSSNAGTSPSGGPSGRAAIFERLASAVVRRRWLTLGVIGLITALLLAGAGRLAIVIDPDGSLPQSHPYVVATNLAERVFGNKFVVVVGITPRTGDALQPAVVAAVRGITQALERDPGVARSNIASLAARQVKDIAGSDDGLAVRPMLPDAPGASVVADRTRLEAALARNPVYAGLLLSRDRRTASVIADFRKGPGGYRAIAARVAAIVAPFRSADLRIDVAGQPIFLALTEVFSDRMAFLFPLALIVIGLIHLDAFRSWQGLALPLVTGLVASGWAVGIMGWTGTSLDAFNAATPILILAVGAGHAVQILKRYYEEYRHALAGAPGDPLAANRTAIIRAVGSTGPVMVAAGLTAAVSFLSLALFQITSIRVFGVFTGLGILSALAIELTLIPALRSILPPPGPRQMAREVSAGVWDRLAFVLARLATRRPRRVLAVSLACFVACIGAATMLRTDNSLRSYFFPSLEARQEDQRLNAELAGNNVLQVIVQGDAEDAIKSPAVLRGMAAVQRFLAREPAVGKTVSLVDFLRQIDRAMNADAASGASPDGAPDDERLPDSEALVAQYLLLYSMSGAPEDFDSYVDSGYRTAVVTAYLKEESSVYLTDLERRLEAFASHAFPPGIHVLIGGNVMLPVALNEVLVESKLLNIGQIALAVFLISSLLFRSWLAGALVATPLAMAVAANFGLMGATGIPLQVATATVSATAVGIGADYAIYLLYRLREEIARGGAEGTPEQAMERTLGSAGKAVMFVATAIAGGYSVMMASWGFMIHIWLGLLIGAAMLVSAAAALTTLPALVIVLRPAFLFGAARTPARAPRPTLALLLGLTVGFSAGPHGATTPAHAQSPSGQSRAAQGLSAQALSAQALSVQALSAEQVMQRNFVASKVADSTADVTFTLISSDGQQRVRRTRSWTKLRDDGVSNMRLTRFVSPPDVRGTATLTIENASDDDDIWIYLPALKRVRRLLASDKKDSYVGTDFSYGDIIGLKVEQWRHTIVRQEAVDGVPCYVVDSLPATQAAVANSGYSRRLQWIRADNFVTVRGQYFDSGGRLWKTFAASDLQRVDPKLDRWQPMRLESRDVQANHTTVIQLEDFRADQGLSAEMFNARVLDREQ
jgi:predicted RND superfamily exporter protein/outer membrane lipoprotein-sorting protein